MDIIEKTIKLCRLEMNQDEIEKIKKDVENILDAFSSLSDLEEDEMAFHSVPIENIYRNDEVKKFENVDELLSQTKTLDNYIKGPKVL